MCFLVPNSFILWQNQLFGYACGKAKAGCNFGRLQFTQKKHTQLQRATLETVSKSTPNIWQNSKNPAQIACFLRVVCMFWWCFGLNLASACNKKQWSVEGCKTDASNMQLWGRFQNQPRIPDKIQKPCKSCTFFACCLHVLVMFWCKSC